MAGCLLAECMYVCEGVCVCVWGGGGGYRGIGVGMFTGPFGKISLLHKLTNTKILETYLQVYSTKHTESNFIQSFSSKDKQ